MSYRQKYRWCKPDFDYRQFDFLDWLYFYIRQDIQKEIIKAKNRQPKKIKIFDHNKCTLIKEDDLI